MIMKNIMLALAIGFAVVGCASSPLTMDFDYDTTTDFAAQKTFAWMPATGNAVANELLVKRIRSAVDHQLQAKGRAPAADNPNFLIAMDLSGKTAYGGSTGVGVSVGIPVGRAGRVSVGGGKSKPIETKEGMLVLHFLDAKTKSLFWQATASGAVEPGASPEEQQKRINDVIAQMLAQFPPKK
jgi:NAD(P)H-dependent FMN reductase